MKRKVLSKEEKFMQYVNESRDKHPETFSCIKDEKLYLLEGDMHTTRSFILASCDNNGCRILKYDMRYLHEDNDFLEEVYNEVALLSDVFDWIRADENKDIPFAYDDLPGLDYANPDVIQEFDDDWEIVDCSAIFEEFAKEVSQFESWEEVCENYHATPTIHDGIEEFYTDHDYFSFRIYYKDGKIFFGRNITLKDDVDRDMFSSYAETCSSYDYLVIEPNLDEKKFELTAEQEAAINNLVYAVKMASAVGLKVFHSPEMGIYPINGHTTEIREGVQGRIYPKQDFRLDTDFDEVFELWYGSDYVFSLK